MGVFQFLYFVLLMRKVTILQVKNGFLCVREIICAAFQYACWHQSALLVPVFLSL
jgi:hypothetical protein